jgi:hypothetical protein
LAALLGTGPAARRIGFGRDQGGHRTCRHAGRGHGAARYLARVVRKTALSVNGLLGHTPDGRINLSWQSSNIGRWSGANFCIDTFLHHFLTRGLPMT